MSKENQYKRTHQFTPYTKADGAAVSDEFDAIQAFLDLIPELRDDGKGFATSPIIPTPTDPNHPVPYSMLTETEKSVNNARDEVLEKAQQVAKNTETVATNTQTAINQASSATQSATSAAESSRSADESEGWARKWASNPVNEAVSGDKYSAYHYATQAEQSARNLSTAASAAENSANIATQKAEEAKTYSDKAASAAIGEIDYDKVRNVPRASTTQDGVTRLTSDTGLDSETLGLTAKAGKFLAQGIAALRLALNNYIPLNKRSSAVNSNSSENVATSAAVKTAYDKAIEVEKIANLAKSNADERIPKQVGKFTFNAQSDGNFTVSENGVVKYDLAEISKKASRDVVLPEISHLTNGESKEKIASEYAVGEISKLIEIKNKELGDAFQNLNKLFNKDAIRRAINDELNSNLAIRSGDDDNYTVKYLDGTMIQVVTYSTQLRYQNRAQYLTWRESFVAPPIVFTSPSYTKGERGEDINARRVGVSISKTYSTSSKMSFDFSSEDNDFNFINIKFFAIGRWK